MGVNFVQHLLIDGANVLHASPELRELLKRDRDTARSQLIQQVAAIHDGEQIRVTVVFDGRGSELIVERPLGEVTFSVVYTPSSLTADDVIEQYVGRSANPADCVVATGDRAEAQTVRATGAHVISPDELLAWGQRAQTRLSAKATGIRRKNAQDWRKP